MNLRVTNVRRDGAWQQSAAYIDDGPLTFFLDPNKPRALRFKPNNIGHDGQWPGPWAEVDMDRLAEIHRLLTEATPLPSTERGETR